MKWPFSKLKSQMEVGHRWVGGGKRWIWHQLLKTRGKNEESSSGNCNFTLEKIGGFRRNASLLWKACFIPCKECDPQRTTFLSFENRIIFDIHYIKPNLIPRFQLQAFFVKDEAAIHPEAQEMHFETVKKEGRGGAPKNRKYGWTKVRGGIPITTIIAQWMVDFNLYSGMLMASLWSTYPSEGLWRRLLYNFFWIVKTGCFSGSAKASEL